MSVFLGFQSRWQRSERRTSLWKYIPRSRFLSAERLCAFFRVRWSYGRGVCSRSKVHCQRETAGSCFSARRLVCSSVNGRAANEPFCWRSKTVAPKGAKAILLFESPSETVRCETFVGGSVLTGSDASKGLGIELFVSAPALHGAPRSAPRLLDELRRERPRQPSASVSHRSSSL